MKENSSIILEVKYEKYHPYQNKTHSIAITKKLYWSMISFPNLSLLTKIDYAP